MGNCSSRGGKTKEDYEEKRDSNEWEDAPRNRQLNDLSAAYAKQQQNLANADAHGQKRGRENDGNNHTEIHNDTHRGATPASPGTRAVQTRAAYKNNERTKTVTPYADSADMTYTQEMRKNAEYTNQKSVHPEQFGASTRQRKRRTRGIQEQKHMGETYQHDAHGLGNTWKDSTHQAAIANTVQSPARQQQAAYENIERAKVMTARADSANMYAQRRRKNDEYTNRYVTR